MLTLTVTKQMIADEICSRLCGMIESNQDESFESCDKFVFIKDFKDGKNLIISYSKMLEGYNAYDGYKAIRIPEFISNDWDRAFDMYKRLKNI
jgi:hypothetical protein